ncbi:MAG: tRNA pseudouridine(38-40) synthase TruA [Sedimentisphaeraceae bacterium JB056]
MLKNIKLTISYDGNAYHGWARQKDAISIQEVIENALERLFDQKIHICGTSRTDAGVHALGQVANMVIDTPIPIENMKKAINPLLPNDIAIVDVEQMKLNFDPIGAPIGKHYRYTIYTGDEKPVFDFRTVWHYPYGLDVSNMSAAAERMVGTKDFKSFASAKDYRTDSIRTITRCEVSRKNDWITIDVEGNRFMYNMVRNMVGTLVEVGRGRWMPEIIDDIIAAKDRRQAGLLAPPNGLCLMKIFY